MNWVNKILSLSILLAMIAGCSHLSIFHNPDNGKVDPADMLPPIKPSSDSVGVEIFFIRRSVTNVDSAKELWENVSELPFSERILALRRRILPELIGCERGMETGVLLLSRKWTAFTYPLILAHTAFTYRCVLDFSSSQSRQTSKCFWYKSWWSLILSLVHFLYQCA